MLISHRYISITQIRLYAKYPHIPSAHSSSLTLTTTTSLERGEAKKILKMARDAYAGTPEERRSFRSAVGLAERQFESVVSEPDAEDEG